MVPPHLPKKYKTFVEFHNLLLRGSVYFEIWGTEVQLELPTDDHRYTMYYTCRKHFLVLSSFMTYQWVSGL